jgi:hypothetical protein
LLQRHAGIRPSTHDPRSRLDTDSPATD